MSKWKGIAVAALVGLSLTGISAKVLAQEGNGSGAELSLAGGFHVLNENDTALPARVTNVPLVATVGYRTTPVLGVEGEFTWMIPVQQRVDLGSGPKVDRKTPDLLAYQANVRANWPLSTAWWPYVTAGAGAL